MHWKWKNTFELIWRYAITHMTKLDHLLVMNPDSKIHGNNMGTIWGRQGPGGPHVGPMNFAILEVICLRFNPNDSYIFGSNWKGNSKAVFMHGPKPMPKICKCVPSCNQEVGNWKFLMQHIEKQSFKDNRTMNASLKLQVHPFPKTSSVANRRMAEPTKETSPRNTFVKVTNRSMYAGFAFFHSD